MTPQAADYFLLAAGTTQDYIHGIWKWADTVSTYWEVDAVITSGGAPDETNITRLTIQLVSDNNKKLRMEPITVLSRNTIVFWWSDGGGTDWGEWSGEYFSPRGYIDGYITATLGAGRTFQHATYGCQDTIGNKGMTIVETSDMFSAFIYGKGAYAAHWQFGIQAGRIWEWAFEGIEPWGVVAGNPTMGSALSANTLVYTSTMPPGINRLSSHNTNNTSKSTFTRIGDQWMSVSAWGSNATNFTGKLGDPSGTQYEPLSPLVVSAVAVRNSNIQGSGVGFTPYIRMLSAAPALDTIYDSPFSSTISWRCQYHVNAQETLSNATVWIWPQGVGINDPPAI